MQSRLWPKFVVLFVWLEAVFAGATIFVRRGAAWQQDDVVSLFKAVAIAAAIALFAAGLWRSRFYKVFFLFSFFAVGFSGGYLDNVWIGVAAPFTAFLAAILAHRSAEALCTSAPH